MWGGGESKENLSVQGATWQSPFEGGLRVESGGVLKFGFSRDVPPRSLKVDPYKYQFFKKK